MAGVALYFVSTRPPGQIISIKDDGNVTMVGGHFVLLVHTSKQRYCPENKQRWLFHKVLVGGKPTTFWLFVGSIPQPPIQIGEDYYGVELPLPAQADPGDWSYMSHTDYLCGMLHGLFGPAPSESPRIPLKVISPIGEKVLPLIPLAPTNLTSAHP